MKLTPTPEQEELIAMALETDSGAMLNASFTGVGKSLMGVEMALRMWARRTLVIAPGSVYEGWRDTFRDQSDGAVNLRWAGNGNKAQKEAFADLMAGAQGYYFMTREMFRLREWSKTHVDVAIYDEIQAASNKKSKGAKAWRNLKAGFKIASSKDWFGNDFTNAWTVARGLWPKHIPASFYLWRDEWCETEFSAFAFDKKKVSGEKIPGAFVRSLPCYGRLETDLDEPIYEDRWVDLTPAQRKTYDRLERDMVAYIENNPLTVELPITLRTRLRQLTLGMVTVDEAGGIDFAEDCVSTKISELLSIVEDHQAEKILVLMDSAKFAAVVTARLNKAYPGSAGEWSGRVSHDDREALKQEFVSGDKRFIVATISSIGEGVDSLQEASSTIVMLSQSDNALLNGQAVARLNRRGQTKPVVVYRVMARETYDSGQVSTLMARALANNASMRKG
jgi:superfamily II DNA or RNA helicase